MTFDSGETVLPLDIAEKVKPFLRWAGSKRKQLPVLREYWSNDFDRYVEPFAGSACFFFDVAPKCALLADKNEQLIETFTVARNRSALVYDRVAAIPRTKETYYGERAKDPCTMSPLRRAVRFIYLNRNCFNGIYRTNLRGEFNVPFAASRAGRFVTREEFLAAASMLNRADLRCWDFGTTLRHVKEGDFVYLDPPYAVTSRRMFKEYGKKHFQLADLARLSDHLVKIAARGAAFVLSYADCKEAREIGRNWICRRIRVRRYVAGFSGARRSAYELLITNME